MMRPLVEIVDARPAAHTAAPAIIFRLRFFLSGRVHAMALRAQVQFNPRARPYSPEERARLSELFGDESQFARMLRPVVWSHASLVVPSFHDEIECDLFVPCTYDLEVASVKYLHAVRDGELPLTVFITGMVFCVADGRISIEPVPWDVEAPYQLPASVWRAAMDTFFPGGGWVRLQQNTIDKLQQFRGRAALVSWDATIDRLLADTEERGTKNVKRGTSS